jgi:XTP/dITP diphosphohydrolase
MNIRVFEEKKLVIASHNKGKIREIKELLKPLNIKILSAHELQIVEPIEDGLTFEENALIKSKFVSKETGLPCISDDSGICFKDLNDEPGIYSARWAGEEKNFDLAMLKVHKAIKNITNPNLKCNFVCSLSICWPDLFDVTVSGSVEGVFTWPPRGQNGFGYDPVFTPIGYKKTYGELEPMFKHSISHRSIAFDKLIDICFPSLKY